MKISVLIAGYNCAATIQATLDSVLSQTVPADEILVMNDGSTDETAVILKQYEPQVAVLSQRNEGVASARNALIARAQGDLIAFLDSDDVWHPRYLEVQRSLYERWPHAAAVFVGHADFCGFDPYDWSQTQLDGQVRVEILEPMNFFRRFQVAPGPFVLSFCCIPRRVLESIGSLPVELRVAEDVYFCNLLPFQGPVIFAFAPLLGAYRVRERSLASDRLRCAEGEVDAFKLLEKQYGDVTSRFVKEFEKAFASKRRVYAKMLLGVGRTLEARGQLRRSLSQSRNQVSLAKSLALLCLSYLPRSLQPRWPSVDRQAG
jgi:glycosyltransferase involved in cell wall biosynthesis